MNSMTSRSRQRRRASRQSGMTLLLTLGFLCVLLMLVLSLALATRVDRRSAAAGVEQVRSRLVADSALGEAMARLRLDFAGERYPADRFLAPEEDSAWAGRRYLVSGGHDTSAAGLEEALTVRIGGQRFTPSASLAAGAGWIPMLGRQTVLDAEGKPTQAETVVGRYSYVVIDQSGMIDPAAVVRIGLPEDEVLPIMGASVTEISLANLGFADVNRFLPDSRDEEVYGALPTATGRWFSLSHMVKALDLSPSDMSLTTRTLFPFSYDREQFWRDRDADGVYDSGEEADRLDIHASAELSRIYQTFVGPVQDYGSRDDQGRRNAGFDDCLWLQKLDDNPWFVSWKNRAFATYAEPERTVRARSVVAAQTAANLVDYADPDSQPTLAYVDHSGQIHLGTSGASVSSVAGVERTWGVSQVAMRIEADASEAPTGNADDEIAGGDPAAVNVPFHVSNGQVVPEVAYEASVTILGAQLSLHQYEGGPLLWWCPVTTNSDVGPTTFEPWGDIDTAASDIQDFNYPKNYQIPNSFPPNTPIVVRGKFWNHPYKNNKYNTKVWECFRSVASNEDSEHVKVLVDGDPVPTIETTSGVQQDVAYYLQDYVEDGLISLQPNQAIYLFETRTPTEGARDYQDLVVLVTLRRAGEALPTIITTFTAEGTCNINPSNSADMEFTLTKPGGTQILRDDLLYSRNTLKYTGECSYIRFRPKGNSNDNYILVNGARYEVENGRLYEFRGSMEVHLYNDKYGSNGAAMGHWWLGLSAEAVTVLCDSVTYTEEIVPPTTTTPVAGPTPEPGAGSSLKVRAGFQVELAYPWAADAATACPPSTVEVSYTIEAVTSAGKALTCTGTKNVAVDTSVVVDEGTVAWTGEFDMDDWVTLEDAFNTTGTPELNTYTITLARIDQVRVVDYLGIATDIVPSASDALYEAVATTAVSGDEFFHVGVTAFDPFMNDRGFRSPDFAMFWTTTPEAFGELDQGIESAPTGMGELEVAYHSGLYTGICVPNSPLQRLGEIGRVHSYQPARSLRLWAGSSADESGHDADILDVFKIGPQAQTVGRVNINSLQPEVLTALFSGALDVTVGSAVDVVLERRQDGRSFATIGEFFGSVSGLTPGVGTLDAVAEQAAVRLAEKLTVRSNYFTVILCAQALKDVAGVVYKNADGDVVKAAYGRIDVTQQGRYVDPILAEQRLLAIVYRDALTNTTRLERVEFLDE